jgi:hypothetical protein
MSNSPVSLAKHASRFKAETTGHVSPRPIGTPSGSPGSATANENFGLTQFTRTRINGAEGRHARDPDDGKPADLDRSENSTPETFRQLRAEAFFSGEKTFAQAGDHRAATTTDLGYGFTAQTALDGPSFEMAGGMSARRNGLGLDVDLGFQIDAHALEAGASIERDFNAVVNGENVRVKLTLGAEARVGINGAVMLRLHAGQDGVSIQAGGWGFAGANGTLSGSLELTVEGKHVIDGDLTLTASAGAMAGAEFQLTGSTFKASAYAAAGAGLGVSLVGTYSGVNIAQAAVGVSLPGQQVW